LGVRGLLVRLRARQSLRALVTPWLEPLELLLEFLELRQSFDSLPCI
jgi:hypothetical protein